MSKFSELLAQVDYFCKLATSDLDKIAVNLKTSIQAEISGGIRSLNKLVTSSPKAAASEAIAVLDDCFARLARLLTDVPTVNTVENLNNTIDNMLRQVSQASFYTNTQNAGAGYDPITHVGDAWSPAAYLNRIQNHLNNFKSHVGSVQKPQPTDFVKNVT